MTGLLVYASDGGDRYHSRWSCPALVSGQMLNDYDCVDYCAHDHRKVHPALDYGLAEMVESGRTPCRVCTPPLADAETFGHELMDVRQVLGLGYVQAEFTACCRCYPHAPSWPCATAVVLGLSAARPA